MRTRLGLMVTAVVLLAGCTSTTSGKGSGTAPSTPSTSATSSTAVSTGASSSSATSSSPAGNPNWISGTDFAKLPHPDMDCSQARPGGVEVLKVVSADVTGDGIPEAIVRMECGHDASEWPDTVDVYSDTTGTPTVIGSLLTQHDGSYATTITPSGKTITLGITNWSQFAAGCCPDLKYTKTFTWNGTKFDAGPLTDVVSACGDTAFTVTATNQQGATGHSSVVLLFKNRLPQACTVHGYPGLDALTSSGGTLAHATRTLHGFAGGASSIPTITVAPNGFASATAEWMNFNPTTSASCPVSASIAVTPANTTSTAQLSVHVTNCELQIHPTVAGTTGQS